jgi:hypothetical protein
MHSEHLLGADGHVHGCAQTQQPGVNGSVTIIGTTTTAPGIAFTTLIWNLSSGHAILNLYSASYPQPDEPMGCCNNAEVGARAHAALLSSSRCLTSAPAYAFTLSACMHMATSVVVVPHAFSMQHACNGRQRSSWKTDGAAP